MGFKAKGLKPTSRNLNVPLPLHTAPTRAGSLEDDTTVTHEFHDVDDVRPSPQSASQQQSPSAAAAAPSTTDDTAATAANTTPALAGVEPPATTATTATAATATTAATAAQVFTTTTGTDGSGYYGATASS